MSGKNASLIVGVILTAVCVISTVICFVVPEEYELLPTLVTAGCAVGVLLNCIRTWKKK